MIHSTRFGLGFRTQHFAALAERPRGVDWLELLSDNFLGVGGPRRAQLDRLRAEFPVALHGVSLGIANDAPPRADYVAALRELADFVQPLFVSDHLCWTGLGGVNSHDLLPVATTRELLALVSERVARVQDALGRPILLENASAYVKFRSDEMSEAELLAALCERTGCGVLLDVNNLYVNAQNLGVDSHAALAALAPRHVAYLHIAGHAVLPDVRIDSHGTAVQEEVWRLFEHAVRRFPGAHVMLERDDAIPALAELTAELDVARQRRERALGTEQEREVVADVSAASARPEPSPGASWRETQRALWVGVTSPGAAPEALAGALDARTPVSAQRGLRVYAEAYASLAERALATNFPTLARVLTRRDFSGLCAAFARAHPSVSHDYVRFGAPLADFLASFELADCYGEAREALADIARLEQAELEAQEAPDAAARATPQELAALEPAQWDDARFDFSPALRLVFARWDVLSAVRAAASGERPELPKRRDVAYLVARAEGSACSRPLDVAGARALGALGKGATFAEACELAGGEAAAARAARALAVACALGALAAIHVPASRGDHEPD